MAAGATTTIPWGGNHSDSVILAEGASGGAGGKGYLSLNFNQSVPTSR